MLKHFCSTLYFFFTGSYTHEISLLFSKPLLSYYFNVNCLNNNHAAR